LKKQDAAAWYREHFPSSHARDAADEAIDTIDISLPMRTFIDAWIAAYIKAGGKTTFRFD
jgi:hypothetical protein